LREALHLGHNYIGTEHILLGLARESEGVAARVLSNLGVDPDEIRREVVRRLGGGRSRSRRTGGRERDAVSADRPESKTSQTAVDGQQGPRTVTKPIQLFYSYSHKDERHRKQLETHLSTLRRQGLIREWHDRKILPGHEWDGAIDNSWESSRVVLLLISPDFVASDYCYERELRQALDNHEQGRARVIPVIVRPTDWTGTPFSKLQALPENAKPVTTWANRDMAWLNVTKGIRKAIEELQEQVAGDR
jgi:ATP-dependent Clp protease ATP-binding subunit ClpA